MTEQRYALKTTLPPNVNPRHPKGGTWYLFQNETYDDIIRFTRGSRNPYAEIVKWPLEEQTHETK